MVDLMKYIASHKRWCPTNGYDETIGLQSRMGDITGEAE